MFEQFSNITQQQLILLVGILVILLLLLDAYRRTKRKKYKIKEKPQVDKTVENKDQSEQEEHREPVNAETEESNEDVASTDNDDATVEYKFDPVSEIAGPELERAEKTEKEPEPEPEVVLPEPKTWEEAVEQKRKMQIKVNRSSHTEETHPEVQSASSNDSTLAQGIIALHIMAPRNYVFYGEDLVTVFDHYQLNYNRELQTYQGISNKGEVMFNITTAIKPGTFDPRKIQDLQTPGISFFMDISSLSNPKEQFKQMLSLLYKMNEHLGGMLLNETRNRFTQSDVSRITASIKQLDNPEEK